MGVFRTGLVVKARIRCSSQMIRKMNRRRFHPNQWPLSVWSSFMFTVLFATSQTPLLHATTTLSPDSVWYSDNPSRYTTVANTLSSLYGSSNTSSGNFVETDLGTYTVTGTGMVDVTFDFISQDGAYDFEFGYFVVTDELTDDTYDLDTASGKEAWADAALDSAKVIFSEYKGLTTTSVTVSLAAGTSISFYIIPDNTLRNFQRNPDSFSLVGSGQSAWPLFTIDDANPGAGYTTTKTYDGSGDGYDQTFSFYGTTTTGTTGTLVSWEDISRNPYGGGNSDNDFNDLQFFISNVCPSNVVPEASTVLTGCLSVFGLLLSQRKRIWRQFRPNR